MPVPWFDVGVGDLAMCPVEINNVVHKTNGDIKYVCHCPHCLSLVVAPNDPLSQIRGICGDHGRAGERGEAGSLLARVNMLKS